jgi:hypothetical protein
VEAVGLRREFHPRTVVLISVGEYDFKFCHHINHLGVKTCSAVNQRAVQKNESYVIFEIFIYP